ncbi:MAG: DUF5706 domain-containing protein [Salaquimonas sp.]|jgi:hypothetical protein|nr:DUF5706 domain-containing protein [Salaquimonas sp.]
MGRASKISEVELDLPLAGHEGVDTNHASRARIQTLLDQHASLITQTQFADAKSAALITLIGLLALKGPIPLEAMQQADAVSLASAVASALAILFCVAAVFPRYPGRMTRENLPDIDRFSWPALTSHGMSGEDYAKYMHTVEVSQMVHSIAHSNCAVSQILLRKYQMLRIAFLFGVADFALVFLKMTGLF